MASARPATPLKIRTRSMNNVLTVTYKSSQNGEDLFWCKETKKVYIRQPMTESGVVWLTTSKWVGGYEASCPMREGLTMRVVDKSGTMLFEEKIEKSESGDGYTYASKNGDFSYEAIRKIVNEFKKKLGNGFKNKLTSYEDWKKWILSDKEKYGNTDYDDNWMFYWLEETYLKVIDSRYCLGEKVYIGEQGCRHKVSGKEWIEYLVLSEDKIVTLELIGFRLK